MNATMKNTTKLLTIMLSLALAVFILATLLQEYRKTICPHEITELHHNNGNIVAAMDIDYCNNISVTITLSSYPLFLKHYVLIYSPPHDHMVHHYPILTWLSEKELEISIYEDDIDSIIEQNHEVNGVKILYNIYSFEDALGLKP